jgi:excisionase family DNA binding protein
MKDKLLTIKEVANYLRVSERSVLRYIEAGRLEASKVGWWRVKQSDLDKFLKENSNLNPREKKKQL